METTASNSGETPKPLTAKERLAQSLSSLTGLKEIEELISSTLTSDAPLLIEISDYLHKLGGKRMRPIFCLLISRLFGMEKPTQELIDVAAGIELIHMATLLHDDIIDNSPKRRHQESPYKKYGTAPTLVAGDFLLARGFGRCGNLDRQIVEATEQATVELTEGEVLETPLFIDSHDLNSSITIARKKTASLFRLACFAASHLATKDEKLEVLCAEFGETIGTAFQILDDILDVTASEDLLGKKPGIDILERKPSIVNVLWLDSGSKLAERLKEEPGENEAEYAEQALAELQESQVIVDAKALAEEYAAKSREILEKIVSESSTVDEVTLKDLYCLVEFVIERMG